MKKSSIFVTILLVVSLCFAVSCPKGAQVSITGTSDISKEATVGEALPDFTFDIEVVNGAFVSDAKDQELTIKGLDAFDASGTGTEAKATAKAVISALADADATTKKQTKATVTVSGFTAKAATQGAKELTFEIPEVKSDAKKYLEDTTSKVVIGGKKVSISASNPVKKVAAPTASPASLEFTAGTVISGDNTATFTLGEGAKWKTNAAPTIATDNGLTFTIERTNDTVMTLTISGTPTTAAEAKDYSFVINDLVDRATGYTIDANTKAIVSVTVKAATPAEKSDIKITSSVTDFISIAATKDQTASAVFTLEGGTWATEPTLDGAGDKLSFKFEKDSSDSTKLNLTVTALEGVAASTGNGKEYSVSLTDAHVTVDSTHKLNESKITFSVKIVGTSS